MSDYDAPYERRHRWTAFELNTLLALICKGMHKEPPMVLTDALNKALNPSSGPYANHPNDIDVDEVQDMLNDIMKHKKAAMAFIERQPGARITRMQKRVFERDIDFTGTIAEWEGGRKARVMAAQGKDGIPQRKILWTRKPDEVCDGASGEAGTYEPGEIRKRHMSMIPKARKEKNSGQLSAQLNPQDIPLPSIEEPAVAFDTQQPLQPLEPHTGTSYETDSGFGWTGGFAAPPGSVRREDYASTGLTGPLLQQQGQQMMPNTYTHPSDANWGGHQGPPQLSNYNPYFQGEQELNEGVYGPSRSDPFITGGLSGNTCDTFTPNPSYQVPVSPMPTTSWGEGYGEYVYDDGVSGGYRQLPGTPVASGSGWDGGFAGFAVDTSPPDTTAAFGRAPSDTPQMATRQPQVVSNETTYCRSPEQDSHAGSSTQAGRQVGSAGEASEPFVHPDRQQKLQRDSA